MMKPMTIGDVFALIWGAFWLFASIVRASFAGWWHGGATWCITDPDSFDGDDCERLTLNFTSKVIIIEIRTDATREAA